MEPRPEQPKPEGWNDELQKSLDFGVSFARKETTKEDLICHLTYRSYWAQRELYGMTAEAAATIFKDASKLESAYQMNKEQERHEARYMRLIEDLDFFQDNSENF